MEPSDFIMNYFYKILEWDIQKYLIPEKRLSSAEIDKKIEQHSKNLHDRASRCMGYQLSS
jgi:histidine decarboxylase